MPRFPLHTRHLKTWPDGRTSFLPALAVTWPALGTECCVISGLHSLAVIHKDPVRSASAVSSSLLPGAGWLVTACQSCVSVRAHCKPIWEKITPTIKLPGLCLGGVVERHIFKYLECQEMFFTQKLDQKSPFYSATLLMVSGVLK